jgi:iron(III) transport system substrate-binding protein
MGMEALHREKLLQRVKSPYFSDLMPQAIVGHGEWVGTSMDVYVQAYNTQKLSKDELPKTYQDLLDPRWKGQLAVEADDYPWFATLIQALGQEKGTKLFKDIVAKNGISVRKGHTLLVNLVGSGEIPLGLSIYNYTLDPLKQKGAPVESFTLEPTVASFKGIGMLKKAPHPYAAILFYDFVISEGQKILADRSVIPTSNKIDVPLKNLPLKFIDPVQTLDLGDQWLKTYEEIITKNAR